MRSAWPSGWNSKHPRALGNTVVFNYLLPGLDPKTLPIKPKAEPALPPWKWTNLPLQAITHLHVYEILKTPTTAYRDHDGELGPLFKKKPEIAKRVQCFLNGMFRHWKARGRFKGENPAGKGEDSMLHELIGSFPKGGHHQDIRVDELPPLVAFLHEPQRDDDLITSDQLATALGVSTFAVRNARKRYGLVGHKEPGRMWKNASYVYKRAECERVFKRPIPPVVARADEELYASILEVIILTLARSDMICKLKWNEIKRTYPNTPLGMIIYDEHKTKHYGYSYGSIITPRMAAIFDAMSERREQLGLKSPYVFPHGPDRAVRTKCGQWTSPTSRWRAASSIWPWCSTGSAALSRAGGRPCGRARAYSCADGDARVGRNRRAFHVLCFCRRVREKGWSVFMK
jgi:hypothetical protein